MAGLASEIIALLPLSLVAPLGTALVLALVFRTIFPRLQSAVRDDRMPLPRVVRYAYWIFVVSTVVSIIFLMGLTLYRLL